MKRAIFNALGNPCRITLVLKLASPFRKKSGRMTNITKALMISDTLIIVMLLLGEETKVYFTSTRLNTIQSNMPGRLIRQ